MIKKFNLENNSFNRLFMFGFTIVVLVVSILTPPFQSPDEFKHFERAYTLSNGEFFLDKTGSGFIDDNLVKFEKLYEEFPFKYNKKNSVELETEARSLHWSVDAQNISLVNTAVYFPAPYIPQSLGILLGKMLDLSIYDSYRLSKLITIFLSLSLVLLANKIYVIPPAGYFILSLPMTIFQISSTSPDGIIFALSYLLGALIAKGVDKSQGFNIYHFILACFLFFIIATMKINMMPIIILLFMVCTFNHLRCGYRFIFLTVFSVFAWVLFAYSSFLSGENFSQGGISAAGKIRYYIDHKAEFIQMFLNTFGSIELMVSHLKQFLGVLGWLDTPLSNGKYAILLFLGVSILLISFCRGFFNYIMVVNFLVLVSIILMTYFLLLITWTPVTENVIHGVQGRYFIPAAIIFIYMMKLDGWKLDISKVIVLFSLLFSSIFTISALSYRYLIV